LNEGSFYVVPLLSLNTAFAFLLENIITWQLMSALFRRHSRWMILAAGASILFGMVHILIRRTASSDSMPRPDGDIGAAISPHLSTSTIRSGSISSEPNP